MVQRAVRPETPARLRLLVTFVIAVAVLLFGATASLMGAVQSQVRTIGDHAAPQAATSADLYFALSDMDAQVARLVLVGDTDALAGTQIDALGTYRERSSQVDADIQQTVRSGGDAVALLDDLAAYRERVWQTLTTAGDKHGYYTQATNIMHQRLLPEAQRLRDESETQLDDAYAARDTTQNWGMTLTLVLGLVLICLLIALQVWLSRRFRRVLNPALILATVLTLAVVLPAAVIFGVQGSRLSDARTRSLDPYLALSQARAVSYDAAADTSRYLISDNNTYAQDFTRKSACLATGSGCDAAIRGGLPAVAGDDVVVARWKAYQADHEKIVGLKDAGQDAQAIGALTGIKRGDATFDFSYYDAAVDQIATQRKAAFDDALHGTRLLLTGWVTIPLGVLVLILILVPLAVRARFAEYR